MSSLIVSGDTSGSITLSAPAVSGSSVLTLPVTTDTLVGRATTDTLTNKTLGSTVVQASNAAPCFSAYQSITQTLSNITLTKIQLQTEEFDTNSNFDSTTNYRFTPTVAGYYQLNGVINISGTTGFNYVATIYKNGSEYKRGNQSAVNSTATNNGVVVSCLVYCNGSTDYVELYGYQASGGSVGTNITLTYFQGFLARSA